MALRRAAHQVYDSRPLVFEDPLAVQILGAAFEEELYRTETRLERPYSVALRAFLVARSRYAEDCVSRAFAAGVRQYCLLGAGLDTFGYRNEYPGLRVFEVDHPATQRWKLGLLGQNRVAIPESLTHVSMDLECQSMEKELPIAGFNVEKPAVFAWLGVVPYLTYEAFRATIRFVAQRPIGSGLILDYGQPREALPLHEQLAHDSLASRVALAGEPFRLFFRPEEMLRELDGFVAVEDLGTAEINARYFDGRPDELRVRGSAGRMLSAWL